MPVPVPVPVPEPIPVTQPHYWKTLRMERRDKGDRAFAISMDKWASRLRPTVTNGEYTKRAMRKRGYRAFGKDKFGEFWGQGRPESLGSSLSCCRERGISSLHRRRSDCRSFRRCCSCCRRSQFKAAASGNGSAGAASGSSRAVAPTSSTPESSEREGHCFPVPPPGIVRVATSPTGRHASGAANASYAAASEKS